MKIIIVGCGQVGETLAAVLGSEGNDITVVDLSSEKINTLTAKLDVMGIVGNGATHTTLESAGIDTADLLIAVTDSDELNLLCCIIAKRHGSCRVIARVQSPEYSTESAYLKDEIGLAMLINPEEAAAQEIARVLRFPAANKIDSFSKGRVELLKFKIEDDSILVGMSVKDVIAKLKCDILVCTVERGDDVYITKGDFVFSARDTVSVIASPKSAADFFEKIGYSRHSVKDALIIGAGDIAQYLCDILKKSHVSLKVIDSDRSRCEALAAKYKNVTVINGDETDRELLIEEGVERTDAFIALTNDDEDNVFLSLFASSVGNGKILAKINKPEYDDVVEHLDIDTTIYPKNITADIIVRYVRAMKNTLGSNVETMYSFIKGVVEAAEFTIGENSPISQAPISELKLRKDVLIAAILRGDSVIIPRGSDRIKCGDSVVTVSKILGINDISDVLLR